MKRSRGLRTKTRHALKQRPAYKPPVTKFLQEFNMGQKVVVEQEPSSQKGVPHPRYKGRVGKIIGKRGKSYIVEITDGNKVKRLISRPEHLKAIA